MERLSRRKGRRERRDLKRRANLVARSEAVGSLADAMNYIDLYRYGKKCCNGVRWKASIQNFLARLVIQTARTYRAIVEGTWEPSPFNSFTLTERGKARPIDAPLAKDRQVHKTYTQNVLLKIYPASMIKSNGASLKGKGLRFTMGDLKEQLYRHFRRYGRKGYIILYDFEAFFPSAPQQTIIARHEKYITDDGIRALGDRIVTAKKGGRGVPLGVEASQIEMVALPSALDNYIRAQLHYPLSGHYMDDFYIIAPPDTDVGALMDAVTRKAASLGLTVNPAKTRVIPLDKPFRFCKATYTITETGKIFVRGNIRSFSVAKRKMRTMKRKLDAGEITLEDVRASVQSVTAYFRQFDNHDKVLRLRRMYHAMIGGTI